MCSDYRLEVEAAAIFEDFADLKIKIRFSEGTPKIQARQDIKITDTAPIVRTIDGGGRRRRSRPAAVELAGAKRQASLQFPIRGARVRLGPVSHHRRWLL